MAIWKDGRISIEIALLGKIARPKLRVWTNPYWGHSPLTSPQAESSAAAANNSGTFGAQTVIRTIWNYRFVIFFLLLNHSVTWPATGLGVKVATAVSMRRQRRWRRRVPGRRCICGIMFFVHVVTSSSKHSVRVYFSQRIRNFHFFFAWSCQSALEKWIMGFVLHHNK
jgi:hypothetical protein